MPAELTPDYSDAYEKIIGNNGRDLSSMIAYALYKGQKREFIIRNGLKSNDPGVINYHKDLNSMRIEGLKIEANALLERYTIDIEGQISEADRELAIEHAITTNVTSHVSGEAAKISKLIEKSTGAWKSIAFSALGSFAFGVFITFAIIIRGANPFAPWLENSSPSAASGPAIPSPNAQPFERDQPKIP